MTRAPGRRRLRERLAYAAYLLLCAELFAKALLLVPRVRAALPPDDEAAWRVRWVNRYLWGHRPLSYSFDVYDPTKGWALRPGRSGVGPRMVTANSRGIRGVAEYAPGRRPGVRRVVVVGDSFTFGEGVGDQETFPAQLEARLGPGVEVINLGIHGYGHDQMVIHLCEEGLRYRPDLVVLGYYAGDVRRNRLSFRDYAKPRFVLRKDGSLGLTGSPVPPVPRVLAREVFRPHLLELLAMAWRQVRPPPPLPSSQDLALAAALLDEMRRAAESHGARFLIVDLPPVPEIPLPGAVGPSEAPIVDYARRAGAPLCRTRAELRRRLGGTPVNGVRGHYDAALHRDVADILAECIGRYGLLAPAADGASTATAAAPEGVPVHEQEQQRHVLEEDPEENGVRQVEHGRRRQ